MPDGQVAQAAEKAVEIVKGVKGALEGKDISVTSDRISTNVHKCEPEVCEWETEEQPWHMYYTYNLPFITGWRAAEVHVIIAFEYNGCDVNNARIKISSKSFNKWYNDAATYTVTASAAESKVPGLSGCKDCCKDSTCVTFDVELKVKWDYIRTRNLSWTVRICGDGSVDIQKK